MVLATCVSLRGPSRGSGDRGAFSARRVRVQLQLSGGSHHRAASRRSAERPRLESILHFLVVLHLAHFYLLYLLAAFEGPTVVYTTPPTQYGGAWVIAIDDDRKSEASHREVYVRGLRRGRGAMA